MNRWLVIGVSAALAAGIAAGAYAAGNAATEIGTAHAHALMAGNATSVAMAHTHLHHVINCLVGPKGVGYDAAAGTPCKGQGNGAIPDSAADAAVHAQLEHALATARAGLKVDSLAGVHKDAAKLATTLQDASAAK